MEETARSDSNSIVSPAPVSTPTGALPDTPADAPAGALPAPPQTPTAAGHQAPAPDQPTRRRKATGPRTAYGKRRSSQNALKHGRHAKTGRSYVESVWFSMIDLGEDPKEFARLLGDLIQSHRPATAAEMMLVDDIASLRWQRRRNERAQAALLVRNLERMEAQRARLAVQTEHEMGADALQGEVLEKGLLHAPDCPTKFAELLRWLEELSDMARQGEFSDVDISLRAIYGKDPTLRANLIEQLFEGLASPQPGDPDPDRPGVQQMLRVALAEEMRDVIESYQLYLKEHVEVTRAMREECLAPVDAGKWRFLLRQELGLDRQIERKTRLILAMQKASREAEEARWEQMKKLEALASPPPPKKAKKDSLSGDEGL